MKRFFIPLLAIAGLLLAGAVILTLNTRVDKIEGLDGLKERQYFFGKLAAERSYADGKLSGPTKIYYGDGKIKSEWSFSAGVKQGTAKHYTPEGNLRYQDEYADGKRISRQEFDSRGNAVGSSKP